MDLRRHPPRPAVRVEPGSGTVLQFGSVVVLLAATREAVPFEAELCAALAPWAGDHPPAAGDAVRAMATLLIKYRVGAPALGAAVQDTAGMRLLLHGAVRAMAGGQAGKVELSGLRAATWVDQLLTDPTGSIRITLDDAPPPSGDGTELMTDRAAGGGMVLAPGQIVPHDDLPPPAAHQRQRAVETKVVDNPEAALVGAPGGKSSILL